MNAFLFKKCYSWRGTIGRCHLYTVRKYFVLKETSRGLLVSVVGRMDVYSLLSRLLLNTNFNTCQILFAVDCCRRPFVCVFVSIQFTFSIDYTFVLHNEAIGFSEIKSFV